MPRFAPGPPRHRGRPSRMKLGGAGRWRRDTVSFQRGVTRTAGRPSRVGQRHRRVERRVLCGRVRPYAIQLEDVRTAGVDRPVVQRFDPLDERGRQAAGARRAGGRVGRGHGAELGRAGAGVQGRCRDGRYRARAAYPSPSPQRGLLRRHSTSASPRLGGGRARATELVSARNGSVSAVPWISTMAPAPVSTKFASPGPRNPPHIPGPGPARPGAARRTPPRHGRSAGSPRRRDPP